MSAASSSSSSASASSSADLTDVPLYFASKKADGTSHLRGPFLVAASRAALTRAIARKPPRYRPEKRPMAVQVQLDRLQARELQRADRKIKVKPKGTNGGANGANGGANGCCSQTCACSCHSPPQIIDTSSSSSSAAAASPLDSVCCTPLEPGGAASRKKASHFRRLARDGSPASEGTATLRNSLMELDGILTANGCKTARQSEPAAEPAAEPTAEPRARPPAEPRPSATAEPKVRDKLLQLLARMDDSSPQLIALKGLSNKKQQQQQREKTSPPSKASLISRSSHHSQPACSPVPSLQQRICCFQTDRRENGSRSRTVCECDNNRSHGALPRARAAEESQTSLTPLEALAEVPDEPPITRPPLRTHFTLDKEDGLASPASPAAPAGLASPAPPAGHGVAGGGDESEEGLEDELRSDSLEGDRSTPDRQQRIQAALLYLRHQSAAASNGTCGTCGTCSNGTCSNGTCSAGSRSAGTCLGGSCSGGTFSPGTCSASSSACLSLAGGAGALPAGSATPVVEGSATPVVERSQSAESAVNPPATVGEQANGSSSSSTSNASSKPASYSELRRLERLREELEKNRSKETETPACNCCVVCRDRWLRHLQLNERYCHAGRNACKESWRKVQETAGLMKSLALKLEAIPPCCRDD